MSEKMSDKNPLLSSLKFLNPSSLKLLSAKLSNLVEGRLWAKVLVGMILGLILGLVISPTGFMSQWTQPYESILETIVVWLALPAKFFLKLIQMVVIPLIIASVIRGLASTTDAAQMKSLGLRYGAFVLTCSCLAAALGVGLSRLIRPGASLNLQGATKALESGDVGLSLSKFSPEILVNILPVNPLSSIVEGQMLDVVILAIIGGIALISVESKQANVVLDFLEVVQSICMTVISWAMRIAPFAVFGLITQVAATTGLQAMQSMSLYVLTSFAGFALFILFYLLLVAFTRKISPFTYLKKIMAPMLLAFSTSSSAATMPLTMKVAEEELDVEASTARFLIPLGTTVNMAGSAIWHTSAVIFLAQAYQVDLSLAQIGFIAATSIGSAVGSPGVPGVGIGVLAAVLSRVGIPIEGISLIMGVDRLVDMGCTVVNVSGDLVAATIFGKKVEV